MKKSLMFIIVIFGLNILLGGYSILSGTLKKNIEERKDNIAAYTNTKYFIKYFNGSYDVISGREGGWFTFKAYFESDIFTSGMDNLPKRDIVLKKISENIYAICWGNNGAKIFKSINNTFIFEYKGHLSQCATS